MTEILSIDIKKPSTERLNRAQQVLAAGGLVIVPTETVYGVACDPAVPGALDKLISAKGRDEDKPISRLAASIEQVQRNSVEWNGGIQALAETFWPGSLTLVLKSATGWTGYRVPNHPVPLILVRLYGRPLALTSANLSGKPDTKTAREACASISADLVLDSGPSANKAIPSTVVKLDGNHIHCLREGCVPFSKVKQLFQEGLS